MPEVASLQWTDFSTLHRTIKGLRGSEKNFPDNRASLYQIPSILTAGNALTDFLETADITIRNVLDVLVYVSGRREIESSIIDSDVVDKT